MGDAVTFDASKCFANLTLENGALAIESQAVNQGVKGWAFATVPITGQQYAEFHVDEGAITGGASLVSIGLASGATLKGDALPDGLVVQQGSTATRLYIDGKLAATWAGKLVTTGSLVGIAADADAGTVWVRLDGAWLNGDPVAETGGQAYAVAGKFFGAGLLVQHATPLRKITANFAATSPFPAPVPAPAPTPVTSDTPSGDFIVRAIPYSATALATLTCAHCQVSPATNQGSYCEPTDAGPEVTYWPLCAPCLFRMATLLRWFFNIPTTIVP